jgi:Glucokinase
MIGRDLRPSLTLNDMRHGQTPSPALDADPSPGLAQPWLLADIGGTNARFGWLAAGSPAVRHVATLRAADHSGPAAAARAYLQQLAAELGGTEAVPRAAAFAVAAAVTGDRQRLGLFPCGHASRVGAGRLAAAQRL